MIDVKRLRDRLRGFCVKEKSHLVIGTGYIITTFWHSTALMSTVYGVAAIMATHVIHRTNQEDESELRHRPKHLARD